MDNWGCISGQTPLSGDNKMPGWLIAAFNLLRSGAGPAVRGIAPLGRRLAIPVGGGLAGGLVGQELGEQIDFGFGPDGQMLPRRRRRRRKALTADDLRLALTIASAISKKAAENFILSRVRSG